MAAGGGEFMNVNILATFGSAAAILLALWTIMSNFDKRNADRFEALQRQIDGGRTDVQNLRTDLQKQIDASKEVLRAELRAMKAEVTAEIEKQANRRVV